MKTKIVAFTNLFPRPWEPQRATFNRQQLEWLSQRVNLEVLVPVSWLDWLKARHRGENTTQSVSSIQAKYFRYFYTPKVLRWSYGCTLCLSSLQILSRLIGQNRPDVIYTPWVYPDGFAMIVIGRLLKIPVVTMVQGSDINVFPAMFGVRPQIVWTLKHAAKVIAVSQDLANKCIALGSAPMDTHVIYNGVDRLSFKPLDQTGCRTQLGLDLQPKIVLYVGNILNSKGCLDLVESFALLKRQRADALLIYVGKGDACEAEIIAYANNVGMGSSVKFVGTQPLETIATWMGAADVVSLPSYNEGVPNVLMEAMACGKPIVATNVGGIPEVVPTFAGILVEAGNVAAIAEALLKVLETSWDKDKIVQHIAPFTWENNIVELQALLESKAKRI